MTDNLKNGKRIPVMHGELMFTPIDSVPDTMSTSHKLYIAGHSETGHHHILESETEFEVFDIAGGSVLFCSETLRSCGTRSLSTFTKHEF